MTKLEQKTKPRITLEEAIEIMREFKDLVVEANRRIEIRICPFDPDLEENDG